MLGLVKRGRLRWYSNVIKMREKRLSRQLLDWIPDQSPVEPVERTLKRWRDAVEGRLTRRSLSIEQALEDQMYDDRVT